MKRISLLAAAVLLVAGTQLHAQATKQDSTKKATTAAVKPAAKSHRAAKTAKSDTSAAKTVKKAHKSKKGAAVKKDSTAKTA